MSSRLDGDHRQLLFGIRRRMLSFIVMLIVLGYGIGYLKTETLVDYVVSREKVDLQDESQNKKLAMELALQTAYSQIISHERLPKAGKKLGPLESNEATSLLGAEAIDLPLKPLDPNRGISDGALLATIDANDLLSHSAHLDEHFEISSLRELATHDSANPSHSVKTLWSRIYWAPRTPHPGVKHTDEHVWIQLLRRENDRSPIAGTVNEDAKSPTRFQLFRLDLTPVMRDLIRGTRQLNYFVGRDQRSKRLWVSPTGNPNPLQASEDNSLNSVDLPTPLELAIEKFELVNPPNKGIPRSGYLWSGEEADEGVSVDQLLIANEKQLSNSLIYSETYKMPNAILEKLNTDVGKVRLEQIEELMRKQDPYVRIDPVDMTVGQIRIRALGPEYLALSQTFVLAYVRELEPNAKLKWKPIVMDNFVLSVQRVELPVDSLNANHNRFLGYLVRSASLEEI
ncbi:hypothetical protein, partial [Novipirellula sp.]|uniref:hypothetical protein n=1 Tax=Novipirellula sp. TaxID=2795430 RepID=UPI0035681B69